MRKIAANFVFPISSKPIKNGIVVLSDKQQIVEIIDLGTHFKEMENLEFYNGIIVPGFVAKASVFEEMKNMQKRNPGLSVWELVTTESFKLAENLETKNQSGSLETGKTPGLCLIRKVDFKNSKLTKHSSLKILT